MCHLFVYVNQRIVHEKNMKLKQAQTSASDDFICNSSPTAEKLKSRSLIAIEDVNKAERFRAVLFIQTHEISRLRANTIKAIAKRLKRQQAATTKLP